MTSAERFSIGALCLACGTLGLAVGIAISRPIVVSIPNSAPLGIDGPAPEDCSPWVERQAEDAIRFFERGL